MELEVNDVARTKRTKKNKKGERQTTEIIRVKMEAENGEKLTLELHANGSEPLIGDEYELKPLKAQTRLPQLEPKLAESIKSGETQIQTPKKRSHHKKK